MLRNDADTLPTYRARSKRDALMDLIDQEARHPAIRFAVVTVMLISAVLMVWPLLPHGAVRTLVAALAAAELLGIIVLAVRQIVR